MITDNKKRVALLLLLLVSTSLCYSQYTLQKDYIHIRANDTVVKQEVNYKDPGRSGTNVFWNYSNLQPVKFPYCVCYGGNDTVVFVKEHLTEYKYRLNCGDSLMLEGYRNRTTYFNALVPGLEFRYPFHYMDSLESNFYGEGKYSDKLAFISQGREKVKVDAWGTMLLPGNDTLKNVVRMCPILLITGRLFITVFGRINRKVVIMAIQPVHPILLLIVIRLQGHWHKPANC